MKFSFLLLVVFFLSPPIHAKDFDFCPGSMLVTLETNVKITFCKKNNYYISKNCYLKKDNCSLNIEANKRLPNLIKDHPPYKTALTNNPGSYLCTLLGWKVLMGKTFDGSDLCTCEDPAHDLIICTSLLR